MNDHMKRTCHSLLVFFTLFAAAAGSGCAVSDSRDGTFFVSWSVATADDVPATCTEVGGVSVHLDLVNLDSEQEFQDQFNCKDKQGYSGKLPSGPYRVTLGLYNAANQVVSEYRFPDTWVIYRDRYTAVDPVRFQVSPPDQYFSLSWTIVKDATDAPLTCAQAAAAQVQLVAQLPGVAPASYFFQCDQMSGRTQTVDPGTYTVTVNLLDASNQALSSLTMGGIDVVAGTPTDLPPITFAVK